jgi:hypothetical protein
MGVDAGIITNSDQIFKMFLGVWGSVLGVYSIGRSVEKRGTRNAWTKAITGNASQSKPDTTPTDAMLTNIKNKIKW